MRLWTPEASAAPQGFPPALAWRWFAPGAASFRPYAAGTAFEIPGKSGFDVKAEAPAAYLCEYL